ncbi:MAG: ATP synthase F1 subunit delta [Nitrospirota bacterium]|jgi:F-type H+-transporting ATPase subunit delta
MKNNRNAKRYARMFLGAVGEDAPGALEELALVDALLGRSEDFKNFLLNPVFTDEEHQKGLEAVGSRAALSPTTVKFLTFLSEEAAAGAIPEILRHAVALYAERRGLAKATVVTPMPLNGSYAARLKEALKRVSAREVTVEFQTDPSLLGGVLVKMGSTMFDGSIRGQLRLLKDELIKG